MVEISYKQIGHIQVILRHDVQNLVISYKNALKSALTFFTPYSSPYCANPDYDYPYHANQASVQDSLGLGQLALGKGTTMRWTMGTDLFLNGMWSSIIGNLSKERS